jgi:hypothetical protein
LVRAPALYRLSGLALVLAATMFIIAEIISFFIFAQQGEDYDLERIATSAIFFYQSLLTLLAGALLLGGMVGLYVRQSEAAGRVGVVGFLVAFFVTVFVEGDFYANTFVTPLVALEAPYLLLGSPLSGIVQVWLPFDFVLLALGWLLLAASTVRARVYPRAASWILLLGAVVALVPMPLANLPFEATLGWLGLVLLKTREDTSRRRREDKKRRGGKKRR